MCLQWWLIGLPHGTKRVKQAASQKWRTQINSSQHIIKGNSLHYCIYCSVLQSVCHPSVQEKSPIAFPVRIFQSLLFFFGTQLAPQRRGLLEKLTVADLVKKWNPKIITVYSNPLPNVVLTRTISSTK
jgi:hypothetical protein